MSEIVTGDVTLPDGRKVHAVMCGYSERDVNAWVMTNIEVSWEDGSELTADEYNEEVPYEKGYGGKLYLHEYVAEMLSDIAPEYDDE